MRGHGRRERAASRRRPAASWSVLLTAAVTALAVACTGPGHVSPEGSGHGASAGACGGPAASAYFAGARMVFTGTMLPGPAADVGGHSVLVSPTRARVTRYLKGHGPWVVTVRTAWRTAAASPPPAKTASSRRPGTTGRSTRTHRGCPTTRPCAAAPGQRGRRHDCGLMTAGAGRAATGRKS